jgi:tRNA-specific 2-thiouridylase
MRIVVGMSGGVDSSVAALLLKREGHEVIGVFMNNWDEKDDTGVCTAERDWADVRRVCDQIGIPYYAVNFQREYMDRVFSHFLEEYRRGRTPNPDVLCNREIKFSALKDFAQKLGAEKLATGHFARTDAAEGRARLLLSADPDKDQTYFLYMLSQPQLKMARFPVGDMTKAEVRAVAREAGLRTSEKKDSTGVCFIGERNFRAFLKTYLPAQPGEIRDVDGRVVGRHEGLMYYTPGQRRGLGIGGEGGRWYVVDKDLARNVLVVDQRADSPRLYSAESRLEAATWIAGAPPVSPGQWLCVRARLRHRQALQGARILVDGGDVLVRFDRPQRAVTPGQSTVFYRADECLGGGIVTR